MNTYSVESSSVSGSLPDPEDDDEYFVKKNVNNDNLITIKPNNIIKQEIKLTNLKTLVDSDIYNLEADKYIILNTFKRKSGIYLIHNNINGKQYIGSAFDLRIRLATYYFPSRLMDKRHITNSILKYGHVNFSLVILQVLGDTNTQNKETILRTEQKLIDLYKPALNINRLAHSTLGFKHSEETKKLLSSISKGRKLPQKTKDRLSVLFSGELNPF